MKRSNILFAFAIGFAGGYLLQKSLNKPGLSPEQALQHVKKSVHSHINIDGTWIYQHTEDWEGNHVNQKVYRGGLTERQGDSLTHYDFIVDSGTGSLLSLTQQT